MLVNGPFATLRLMKILAAAAVGGPLVITAQ